MPHDHHLIEHFQEHFRVYGDDEQVDRDGYPLPWSNLGIDDLGIGVLTTRRFGLKDVVREDASNRCVRCGHPYTKGEHGNGEWSPCNIGCKHLGPIRLRRLALRDVQDDWQEHDLDVIGQPAGDAIIDHDVICFEVEARWRILTVHHLNEVKRDCRWWNLAPLCQRCHLTIQGKVKMERPYDRPHSGWFVPYVAGFYAAKYLGQELTRAEALERADELLSLELRQPALFDRSTV